MSSGYKDSALIVRLGGLIDNWIPQKYAADELLDIIVELVELSGYEEGQGGDVDELVEAITLFKG